MQRIIPLLILLQAWLYGCLSCIGGVVYVTTHLSFHVEGEQLQKIGVSWYLDPAFSQIVLGDFDKNRNGQFDPPEVAAVYDNLLPMHEVDFFTDFRLNGTPIPLKQLEHFDVRFEKGLVSYRFEIPVQAPLEPEIRFDGGYRDSEARVTSLFYRFDEGHITLEPNATARISVMPREHTDRDGWVTQRLEVTLEPLGSGAAETAVKPEPAEAPGFFTRSMKEMVDALHGYLVVIQERPTPGAVAMLLLLSLIYGMLHAAGPGHGKMLVASYFTAHDRSYAKAASLGIMIAAVHVFSALMLTMGIYYLMERVFSKTLQEATAYITAGSGIVIIAIALYLFRQKWRHYRRPEAPVAFRAAPSASPLAPPGAPQPHTSSCGCHSCRTTQGSTDLMVVLAAGIVPCPGTVIIFMFAASMGLYLTGLASAVGMSLGMGVTIALTAIIGTRARRSARGMGETAVKAIEFGSLLVMGSLGVMLLFA
jgi:nickel/cobalt exporter